MMSAIRRFTDYSGWLGIFRHTLTRMGSRVMLRIQVTNSQVKLASMCDAKVCAMPDPGRCWLISRSRLPSATRFSKVSPSGSLKLQQKKLSKKRKISPHNFRSALKGRKGPACPAVSFVIDVVSAYCLGCTCDSDVHSFMTQRIQIQTLELNAGSQPVFDIRFAVPQLWRIHRDHERMVPIPLSVCMSSGY